MQFPDARLGIVVASRAEMIRDLFRAYPWLEIIEANRRSPRTLFWLWRHFRNSDLIVTQYAGKPGGSFSLWSKLAARVLAKRGGLTGFADVSIWNTVLYDQIVPIQSDVAIIEHERAALRAVGILVPLRFPTLSFVRDDAVLARFKLQAGKYIVAHLFSGSAGRGLHPDKKRELLALLAEKLPDTSLVISGGQANKVEALRMTEHLTTTIVAGDTTLQELMNIIAHSRGVMSLDTGVAHIAAQLHRPLIVMRTCIGAHWWLPGQYGEHAPVSVFSSDALCTGVGHVYKNYPDCMNAINMQEVSQQVSLL